MSDLDDRPTDSTDLGSGDEQPPVRDASDYAPSVAERLAGYQRAGGIITPVLTTLLAFVMAGLVVLATGHNPFVTSKAIFEGTGLTWFFHFGHYHIDVPFTNHQVFFWWDTSFENVTPANLVNTLLLTTTLVFTGLAVSFAFRAGMFNIGGQGQYIVGTLMAVWIGSSWPGMAPFPHILLAIVGAGLIGAVWAGIAGFLKASVGAHEVITTIMLNWIAYWIGSYLVGRGGPLQTKIEITNPVSKDIAEGAHLPVWWGSAILQGLHIGFFIAIASLVAFWLILNRTTLGYEIRTVGFNAEAARYGGISVTRNYVLAMALAGLFAGLGGAMDILGWEYHIGVLDIQVFQLGFIGIAVALLGRNTAVGVGLAALFFASLINGTSTRNPDLSSAFPPTLAGNLTLIIQAFVLLFVGADVLILYVWQARRKLRPRRPLGGAPTATGEAA